MGGLVLEAQVILQLIDYAAQQRGVRGDLRAFREQCDRRGPLTVPGACQKRGEAYPLAVQGDGGHDVIRQRGRPPTDELSHAP